MRATVQLGGQRYSLAGSSTALRATAQLGAQQHRRAGRGTTIQCAVLLGVQQHRRAGRRTALPEAVASAGHRSSDSDSGTFGLANSVLCRVAVHFCLRLYWHAVRVFAQRDACEEERTREREPKRNAWVVRAPRICRELKFSADAFAARRQSLFSSGRRRGATRWAGSCVFAYFVFLLPRRRVGTLSRSLQVNTITSLCWPSRPPVKSPATDSTPKPL